MSYQSYDEPLRTLCIFKTSGCKSREQVTISLGFISDCIWLETKGARFFLQPIIRAAEERKQWQGHMTSNNKTVSRQKSLGGYHGNCNIYDVKGTEEMSPANIGRFEIYSHKFVDKSFFLGLYFTKHSMTGLKGNSSFCFPRISVYPYADGLLLIHYVANCKL